MEQNLLTKNGKTRNGRMSYHILCIDDDPDFLVSIRFELEKTYYCTTSQTLREGLDIIRRETVDLVLLDIGLGHESGIEGLKQIKTIEPSVDVVMVTGQKDPKLIVASVRAGASDYLCKPIETDDLLIVVEKLYQVKQVKNRHDALIADLCVTDSASRMLGVSNSLCNLLDKVKRVKGHSANILIEGESGTGKELLARHIHNIEEDKRRPFIAVNCASIPDTLIESELFGHEKGSFTGATIRRIGKFELASGGDIFLDEISTLKPELQAKILRTLQEKEIMRVGGTVNIRVDFRVLAATNEKLEKLVGSGRFRMDLFHRLRVIHLNMPPLRERVEDIPLLVDHFLNKFCKSDQRKHISTAVMEAFVKYRWPGNIRELENLIHNMVIMVTKDMIELSDLPEWMKDKIDFSKGAEVPDCCSTDALKEYIRRIEKTYIEKIMSAAKGNKSEAADKLGISRATLYSRLKELGLE